MVIKYWSECLEAEPMVPWRQPYRIEESPSPLCPTSRCLRTSGFLSRVEITGAFAEDDPGKHSVAPYKRSHPTIHQVFYMILLFSFINKNGQIL